MHRISDTLLHTMGPGSEKPAQQHAFETVGVATTAPFPRRSAWPTGGGAIGSSTLPWPAPPAPAAAPAPSLYPMGSGGGMVGLSSASAGLASGAATPAGALSRQGTASAAQMAAALSRQGTPSAAQIAASLSRQGTPSAAQLAAALSRQGTPSAAEIYAAALSPRPSASAAQFAAALSPRMSNGGGLASQRVSMAGSYV